MNMHENICIAGLNRRAGYATAIYTVESRQRVHMYGKLYIKPGYNQTRP
jgi:hypothetical protein